MYGKTVEDNVVSPCSIYRSNSRVLLTDLDGPGVEDHAAEGAVLDVLVVVGDVDAPLARLVGLEGGEEGPVLLAHGAAQRTVRRRVRSHLQFIYSQLYVEV